jgi:hypothetical protein
MCQIAHGHTAILHYLMCIQKDGWRTVSRLREAQESLNLLTLGLAPLVPDP